MTIRAAALYLMSFDAPPPLAPPAEIAPIQPTGQTICVPDAIALAGSGESETREQEIHAALEQEFNIALEAERAGLADRLRVERDKWTSEQAETLGRQVTRELDVALENLRTDVATILTPFISEQISNRVLEELIAAVRAGLSDEESPAIEMAGPRDLLEKISGALADESLRIKRHENDAIDVRVAFGSTMVETCLGQWMAQFAIEA